MSLPPEAWNYFASLGLPGALLLMLFFDKRYYQKIISRLTDNYIALANVTNKNIVSTEQVVDKMLDILRVVKPRKAK